MPPVAEPILVLVFAPAATVMAPAAAAELPVLVSFFAAGGEPAGAAVRLAAAPGATEALCTLVASTAEAVGRAAEPAIDMREPIFDAVAAGFAAAAEEAVDGRAMADPAVAAGFALGAAAAVVAEGARLARAVVSPSDLSFARVRAVAGAESAAAAGAAAAAAAAALLAATRVAAAEAVEGRARAGRADRAPLLAELAAAVEADGARVSLEVGAVGGTSVPVGDRSPLSPVAAGFRSPVGLLSGSGSLDGAGDAAAAAAPSALRTGMAEEGRGNLLWERQTDGRREGEKGAAL